MIQFDEGGNLVSEIIQDLSLEDVLGDRFGRYSKYIIQERALPDVRDGFKKPVQRLVCYTMYSSGNTHDKISVKVRKTVGDVIGQYHPHGDSLQCTKQWSRLSPRLEVTTCLNRNAW